MAGPGEDRVLPKMDASFRAVAPDGLPQRARRHEACFHLAGLGSRNARKHRVIRDRTPPALFGPRTVRFPMAPPSLGRTPKGTARERRWRNGGLPKLAADPVSEEAGQGPRYAVFRIGPEGPFWIGRMASHSADMRNLPEGVLRCLRIRGPRGTCTQTYRTGHMADTAGTDPTGIRFCICKHIRERTRGSVSGLRMMYACLFCAGRNPCSGVMRVLSDASTCPKARFLS